MFLYFEALGPGRTFMEFSYKMLQIVGYESEIRSADLLM